MLTNPLSMPPWMPPWLIPWLPILAFAVVGLLILLLGRLLIGLGRNRRAEDLDRAPRLVFGPFTEGLAGVLPQTAAQNAAIAQELKRAGFYRPLAREQFLAIRNALVVGWLILTALVLLVAYDPVNDPTLPILGASVLVLMLLYAVPRTYLQSLARRRVQRIQTSLPDALDMLTMCMTGGLPLQLALERVSGELRASHADLALELEIIRRQSDAYTLDHALTQFAQRIDVSEIKSLTAIVAQAEQLGTNVATALRDYADSIRRSYRQRAEERGNRTSVKMILPVALCLAPPVYILLLAPAILELRDFVIRENQPGGILDPVEADRLPPLVRETPQDSAEAPTR